MCTQTVHTCTAQEPQLQHKGETANARETVRIRSDARAPSTTALGMHYTHLSCWVLSRRWYALDSPQTRQPRQLHPIPTRAWMPVTGRDWTRSRAFAMEARQPHQLHH